MKTLIRTLTSFVRLIASQSLFRNAGFLIASTGVLSVFGFAFWLFVAHLYTAADIGVASAVISISILISNLSMLGLNTGLIRYIPQSKTASGDINAALILTALAAMAGSAVYATITGGLGAHLPFFTHNLGRSLLFCAILTAITLNSLTDSVFIARRKAQYHTASYAAFGLIRLILPLFLLTLGALGIFLAYAAAGIVALGLSLYFMTRYCDYQFWSRPNFDILRRTRRFITNNYLGTLVTGLPSQLMPSLIILKLDSAQSAYFAMAWTIAVVLYIIPGSIAQSLLAEGSHDPKDYVRNLRHAAKILALVITPLVIIAILIAPYVLRLFGAAYATGSIVLFEYLAISTLFLSISALGNVTLNIEHRTGLSLAIQAFTALVALGGSYLLINRGLTGIGLAFLASNILGAIAHVVLHARRLKRLRAAL